MDAASRAGLLAAGSLDRDLYNASSVKAAETTRVRLYLPGLGTGLAPEDDDDSRSKATTSGRSQSDTARKARRKLNKIANLAKATESPLDNPSNPLQPEAFEEILTIEDDEDDDSDEDDEVDVALLGRNTSNNSNNSASSAGSTHEGGAGGGSRANGANGWKSIFKAGPGANSRPSSSVASRTGSNGDLSSIASRHRASVMENRVPIWNRPQNGPNQAVPREKSLPPQPKVYKALQAKTMTLALGMPLMAAPVDDRQQVFDPGVADSPWPAWMARNMPGANRGAQQQGPPPQQTAPGTAIFGLPDQQQQVQQKMAARLGLRSRSDKTIPLPPSGRGTDSARQRQHASPSARPDSGRNKGDQVEQLSTGVGSASFSNRTSHAPADGDGWGMGLVPQAQLQQQAAYPNGTRGQVPPPSRLQAGNLGTNIPVPGSPTAMAGGGGTLLYSTRGGATTARGGRH